MKQTLVILWLACVLVVPDGKILAQTTWLAPTAAPPNGNTEPPINTGGAWQTKTGNLSVGGIGTFVLEAVRDVFLATGDATVPNPKVGIGVPIGQSATAKLDVRGDIKATSDICTSFNQTPGTEKCLSIVTGGDLPPGTANQTLRYGTTGWEASGLLLNDGSNLGVNVSPDPAAMFSVVAGSGGSYAIIGSNTDAGSGVKGESSLGKAVWAGPYASGGPLVGPAYGFYQTQAPGATTKNRFESRLGIGTEPESLYMLQVAGKIYASDNICAGTNCLTFMSDARLKENVTPVSAALDKVMQLNGVTFDWKEEAQQLSKARQLGMIAQDVKSVVPEVVSQNEETGYYSIQYAPLTALLVEAIKEQQEQIGDLKAEIAALKR